MTTNTFSIFRSKAFWTLLVMGLLPVVNLFVPFLPQAFQAVAEVVLAALATYFHNQTAVTAGAVN